MIAFLWMLPMLNPGKAFWRVFLFLVPVCTWTNEPAKVTHVTIPLLSDEVPIVRGVIPGQGDGFFLWDTGAEGFAWGASYVSRLKLPTKDVKDVKTILRGPGGDVVTSTLARVDEIIFENFTYRLPEYGPVIDLPFSFLAGVVPMSAPTGMAILFDGSSRKIVLIPSFSLHHRLAKLYPDREWIQLRIIRKEGPPTIELKYKEKGTLRLMVDTGANSTQILRSSIQRLGIPEVTSTPLAGQVVTESVSGRTIRPSQSMYRLEGVRYGPWSMGLDATPVESFQGTDPDFDGLLGYDVLGRIPFLIEGETFWILAPKAGDPAALDINNGIDERRRRCFVDPFPLVRISAIDMSTRLELVSALPLIAERLEDDVGEVREAAAKALETFAKESWPAEQRLEAARAWYVKQTGSPGK